jgi:hypothetical protein
MVRRNKRMIERKGKIKTPEGTADLQIMYSKLVITDFGHNGQNLAVYNCGFLEMLRRYEGFLFRKLFKIKRTPI